MLTNLLNPAGGLRYHWRALTQASKWKSYQLHLGQWLLAWDIPQQGIILVGPSAGANLSTEFLSRFLNFTILEVDPLARFLIQRKIHACNSKARVHFIREDLLISSTGQGLRELLKLYPERAVLFCNILGQMSMLTSQDDEELEKKFLFDFCSNTQEQLAKRPWASFHDRLSGKLPIEHEKKTYPARPSDEHLVRDFYSLSKGEVLSHHLPALFKPERSYTYLRWRLTSRDWHLIELYRQ